jgi:hypothetical protein
MGSDNDLQSQKSSVNDIPERTLLGVAAGVAFLVIFFQWQWDLFTDHFLWLLVPIPGVIGLLYHSLNIAPRFTSRAATVSTYVEFVEYFDKIWNPRGLTFNALSDELRGSVQRYTPSLAATVWGALVLTIVFSIPALLTDHAHGLLLLTKAGNEGILALVFSAFGTYIYVMQRLISRVNSGAMSAKFLLSSAFQAAISIIGGYVIGACGMLSKLPDFQAGVYFLAGLFNSYLMEYLRTSAIRVFHPSNEPTERLPLRMIDGIEDDEVSLLAELGVTEIQHLATSDAGVLTIRSLFPFNRVVDWIDQAILITHLRGRIVEARRVAIRSASDYIVVIQNLTQSDDGLQTQAAFTLTRLSDLTGISYDALQELGFNLFWDYRVSLLCRLWQRDAGMSSDEAASATTPPAPMIAIRDIVRDGGFPSADLMALLYKQRVEAEVERQATRDAAAWRGENPDGDPPKDEWFEERYTAALEAARNTASLGAQPKPRAATRDLYKETVLKRLA